MSQDAGFVVSGRNYGLVPMQGQATDAETQLARLEDFMNAGYDAEAAKRAREYYGEGVPIEHISEEDMSFFAGAAFARIKGVPNNPEAYWHAQKKDIPDVEREQMFELLGAELRQQVRSRWDERQQKLQELQRELDEVNGGLADALPRYAQGEELSPELMERVSKFGKPEEVFPSLKRARAAVELVRGWNYGGRSKADYEAAVQARFERLKEDDLQPVTSGGNLVSETRRRRLHSDDELMQQARADEGDSYMVAREQMAVLADVLSGEDGQLDKGALGAFLLAIDADAQGQQSVDSRFIRNAVAAVQGGFLDAADFVNRGNAKSGMIWQGPDMAPVYADAVGRADFEREYSDNVEVLRGHLAQLEGRRLDAAEKAKLLSWLLTKGGTIVGENVPYLSTGMVGGAARLGYVGTALLGGLANAPAMMNRGIGQAYAEGKKNAGFVGSVKGLAQSWAEAAFVPLPGGTAVVNRTLDSLARKTISLPGAGKVIGAVWGNGLLRYVSSTAGASAGELLGEEVLAQSVQYPVLAFARAAGMDLDEPEWQPFADSWQMFNDDPRQAAATVVYCALMGAAGAPANVQAARDFALEYRHLMAAGLKEGSARRLSLQAQQAVSVPDFERLCADMREVYRREVSEGDPVALQKRLKREGASFLDEVEVQMYARSGVRDYVLKRAGILAEEKTAAGLNRISLPNKEQPDKPAVLEWSDEQLNAWVEMQHEGSVVESMRELQARVAGAALGEAAVEDADIKGLLVNLRDLPVRALARMERTSGRVTYDVLKDLAADAREQVAGFVEGGMSEREANRQMSEIPGVRLGTLVNAAEGFTQRVEAIVGTPEGDALGIRSPEDASTAVFRLNGVAPGQSVLLFNKGMVTEREMVEDLIERDVIAATSGENAVTTIAALEGMLRRVQSHLVRYEGGMRLLPKDAAASEMDIVEAFSKLAQSRFLLNHEQYSMPREAHDSIEYVQKKLAHTQHLVALSRAWDAFAKSEEGRAFIEKEGATLEKLMSDAGASVAGQYSRARFDADAFEAVRLAYEQSVASPEAAQEVLREYESEQKELDHPQEQETSIPASASITGEVLPLFDSEPVNQETGEQQLQPGEVELSGGNPGRSLAGERYVEVGDGSVLGVAEVEGIFLSADVPQFKKKESAVGRVEADADGTTHELAGGWNANSAPIHVWRRTDGRLEVISGRHRLAHARRNGVKFIQVRVYDESAARDAAWAKLHDVEQNILDNTCNAIDVAYYFRHNPLTMAEAEARGLLPKTRAGEQTAASRIGLTVAANASDNTFALLVNGKCTAEDAYMACLIAATEEGQQLALDARAGKNGKKNSWEYVTALVRGAEQMQPADGGMLDLFGNDESFRESSEKLARYVAAVREGLKARIGVFVNSSKLNRKADVAKELGVKLSTPEDATRLISRLANLDAAYERLDPDLGIPAKADAWDGKSAVPTKLDELAAGSSYSLGMVMTPEMEDIKVAAVKDGTFMKAPNGKPTRLTEHQWLQVRTGAFKGWFGDWEKVAELTFKVESITQKEADAELQKLAQIPLMNDGEYGVPAEVNRDQREKLLCNTARRKSEANGFSKEEHFFLASRIQKLYKHAVCLGDYRDVNGARNVLAIRRFAAPFVVNGKRGYALLTVKLTERNSRQRGGVVVTNKEARAYSIELDELRGIDSQLQRMESLRMEKMVAFGKLFEPGGTVGNVVSQDSPSPGSEEIVNAFNAKVKEYFEDISKVVDENGEPLVVYHGSPHYGFTVFDKARMGERDKGDFGRGFYFTPNRGYASTYGNEGYWNAEGDDSKVYACFLNIREPMQLQARHAENMERWKFEDAEGVMVYTDKFYDLAWNDVKNLSEIVVHDSTQIKSATDNRGSFDGSNPDITYSVTGGKNLAAVHSIPVDTMLDVEKKLGGLPKPSIAITRLDKPYSWGYSERVYLIGKPELADPQKGNLVYDRDAWTGKGPFLLEGGGAYDYRKGEYFEPTLEEFVARTIKKKGQEDGSSFRGQSAVAIGTMDAVKAHREKLSDTDTSNAQKAETDEALEELIENVVKLSKKGLNEDAVAMVLARVCWRSSPMNHGAPSEMQTSRDTAKRILNELGVRVKDIKKPLVDSFMKAVAGLQNELEDYLESVPQRAVMFNEWEYAVMPESMKGTPGLDEMLERNGIKPVWHDGTEEGRRAALAGLVDDPVVSFSLVTQKMDARYMAAVERGDMDAAQRMVNEVARKRGYLPGSDYQGAEAFNGVAPSSNAYFDTADERYEAWQNGDFEGDISLADFVSRGMDPGELEWLVSSPGAYQRADKYRRESIEAIRKAKASKQGKVTIYRAVPADVKEKSVRNGDWVTLSKAYAEYHISLQDWEKGRIIKQEVSIDDVWWDGNDVNEWGYDDGKEYAYRNTANNRKLLAPVTYDENGDIVPLSKRFNYRSADVSFSLAGVTTDWQNTLDNFVQNPPAAGSVKYRSDLYVCPTPAVMQMVGARTYDIVLSPDVLVKCLDENIVSGVGKSLKELYPKEKRRHAITVETMGQLPASLAEPVCIMVSDTPGCVEVVTELKEGADNILVAVQLNALREGSRVLKVNRIVSLYGKEHIEQLLSHPCLYWDKAKARIWTGGRGLQSSTAPYPKRASGRTILKPADLVKYKLTTGVSFSLRGRGMIDAVDLGVMAREEQMRRLVSYARREAARWERTFAKDTPNAKAAEAMGTISSIQAAILRVLPPKYRPALAAQMRYVEVYARMLESGRVSAKGKLSKEERAELLEQMEAELTPKMEGLKADAARELKHLFVRDWGEANLAQAAARMLNDAADAVERWMIDVELERVERMKERLAPRKLPNGKYDKGKMSADAYKIFERYCELMEQDADTVSKKMHDLEALIAAEERKDEPDADRVDKLVSQMAELAAYGNLKGKSLEAVRRGVAALTVFVQSERNVWQGKLERERERAKRSARVMSELMGPGDEVKLAENAEKSEETLRMFGSMGAGFKSLAQMFYGMGGIPGLRELMDESLEALAYGHVQLGLRERRAYDQLGEFLEKQLGLDTEAKRNDWMAGLKKKIDTKVQRAGELVVHKLELTQEEAEGWLELDKAGREEKRRALLDAAEKSGVDAQNVVYEEDIPLLSDELDKFDDLPGKRKYIRTERSWRKEQPGNIVASRDEILNILLLCEQTEYQQAADENGYTAEVLEKLRAAVGEDVMAYGHELRKVLEGSGLAAVYEAREGIPFPAVQNYWPGKFDLSAKMNEQANALDPTTGTGTRYGMLITRVKHKLKFNLTLGASNVFLAALAQQNNYICMGELTARWRRLLSHSNFAMSLKQRLGDKQFKQLKEFINLLDGAGIAESVTQQGLSSMLGRFQSAHAMAVLAGSPITLIKQTSAMLHAGAWEGISPGRVLWHLLKDRAGKGAISYGEIVQMDCFKVRHRDNRYFTEMMQLGRNANWSKLATWARTGMGWIEKMDVLCNVASMTALYNIKYEQLHAANEGAADPMSEEEIRSICRKSVEQAMELAAQPLRRTQKSALAALSRNALVKSACYMSSESLNKIGMYAAIKQRNGGGIKGRIAALKFLLPMSIAQQATVMALDMLRGTAPGSDDDEWAEWFWLNVATGCTGLGMLQSVPMLGEFVGWATDGYVKTASLGEMLFDFRGAVRSGKRLWKMGTDSKDYRSWEWAWQLMNAGRIVTAGTAVGRGINSTSKVFSEVSGGLQSLNAVVNHVRPLIQRMRNKTED